MEKQVECLRLLGGKNNHECIKFTTETQRARRNTEKVKRNPSVKLCVIRASVVKFGINNNEHDSQLEA